MSARQAEVTRATKETNITCRLALDGSGLAQINTGLAFLDHLLTALTRHARFDLLLACQGDLDVDDHHSVEDCALVLGAALDQAVGDKRGIERFGYAYAPLDEALARAVLDLSGRPLPIISLDLQRPTIGTLATENITHFLVSFATAGRIALHVDILRGANDHHRAEAAFKALALALRQAVSVTGPAEIPSTKGTL